MRILHAGASALYGPPDEEESEAEREADTQSHRGEHLPLHGISEHFESDSNGGRRDGEAVSDGD